MVRAWHGPGTASVNQTRPHCVNQMGKTHSKHLAARRDRGTAWTRRAMCESDLSDPFHAETLHEYSGRYQLNRRLVCFRNSSKYF